MGNLISDGNLYFYGYSIISLLACIYIINGGKFNRGKRLGLDLVICLAVPLYLATYSIIPGSLGELFYSTSIVGVLAVVFIGLYFYLFDKRKDIFLDVVVSYFILSVEYVIFRNVYMRLIYPLVGSETIGIITLLLFNGLILVGFSYMYKKFSPVIEYYSDKDKRILALVLIISIVTISSIDIILESFIYNNKDINSINSFTKAYDRSSNTKLMVTILSVANFYFYIKMSESNKLATESLMKSSINLSNEKYLDKMIETEEKTSKMMHDIKNHMMVMKGIIGETAVEKYYQDLEDKCQDMPIKIRSGNFIADIVVNDKIEDMISNKIYYDIKLALPREMTLDNYELSSILFNTLDNAIEASMDLAEEDRKIIIRSELCGDFVKYDIYNNYNKLNFREDESPSSGHKYSAKDNISRGYGMKIVKEVVEKYDGYMKIDKDDMFRLKLYFRAK